VHLSDTHIGPTADYALFGAVTAPRLEAIVAAINAIPDPVDFVIHTGDVARDPERESYELTSDIIKKLQAPLFMVTGNHDDARMLRERFSNPQSAYFPNSDRMAYSFTMSDEQFIVLDAEPDPAVPSQATLPVEQLEMLTQLLRSHVGYTTVFVHYPLLSLECAWTDDHMMLTNGSAAHQQLMPFASTLRGVFFGHVHRDVSMISDGILYRCTGGTSFATNLWPSLPKPTFDEAMYPRYSYVSLVGTQTIIKDHPILFDR
jgi:3',5'-cyclic AMP phosphodiesterase CpdA